MKKYTVHIVWAVVVVAAFVGGMYYGKSTAAAGFAGRGGAGNFAGFSSSTRGGFAGGGRAGGGFVTGQVLSANGQSITVQLPSGSSQIVFFSSSTSIVVPSPASASALTPGTNVMIGGTTNSDGSLTAQSIQVRPAQSGGAASSAAN